METQTNIHIITQKSSVTNPFVKVIALCVKDQCTYGT